MSRITAWLKLPQQCFLTSLHCLIFLPWLDLGGRIRRLRVIIYLLAGWVLARARPLTHSLTTAQTFFSLCNIGNEIGPILKVPTWMQWGNFGTAYYDNKWIRKCICHKRWVSSLEGVSKLSTLSWPQRNLYIDCSPWNSVLFRNGRSKRYSRCLQVQDAWDQIHACMYGVFPGWTF